MTAQNHIQPPRSHPGLWAQQVLRERGDELLAELVAKVALTAELQMPVVERENARHRLVDFCAQRLVRHLAASDRVLYSAAAGAPGTRLLVRALRAQHALVAARIAELRQVGSSTEVAPVAQLLVGALQVGLHLEQEVLVPALGTLPGVDLAALVAEVEVVLASDVLDSSAALDVRERIGRIAVGARVRSA